MNFKTVLIGPRYLAIAICLFVAGILIYSKCPFFISWDLSEYLVLAKNLILGNGYVDIQGDPQHIRPGFVLLLATSLKIAGGNLEGPIWLIVIFSSLLPVCIFAVGTKIDSLSTGLFASLLFISSPSFIFWTPRHIDPFWPVFLFASILFLPGTSCPKKNQFSFLSGIFLSVAITIKPVAICFLPFALITRKFTPSLRPSKSAILYHYVGFFIVSGLLLILFPQIYADTNSAFIFPFNFLASAQTWPNFFWAILKGFYAYFFPTNLSEGISNSIALGSLLIISFVISTAISWSNNRNILYTNILLFCFLPFLSIVGLYNLRASQNLFIIGLLYISLAYLIVTLGRIIKPIYNSKKLGVFFTVFIFIIIGTAQWLFIDNVDKRRLRNMYILNYYSERSCGYLLRGRSIADWLQNNLDSDHTAMISKITTANGAFLAQSHPRKIMRIPFTVVSDYTGCPPYKLNPDKIACPVIIHSLGKPSNQSSLLILSETDLFNCINLKKVKYLFIDAKLPSNNWLDHNPAFLFIGKIIDTGSAFKIYEVRPHLLDHHNDKPIFTTSAFRYLDWLKENHPRRLAWYLSRLKHYNIYSHHLSSYRINEAN